MRLTTVALVLGVGLMVIAGFVGRDAVAFALPADTAVLAAYNLQEGWRVAVCALGGVMTVVAMAIKLFGRATGSPAANR